MTHDQTLLTAENISKRFGVTQALDDVSVSFAKGEIHALMGENGAGKSTLGKVIAGLHRQDSGRVRLYDNARVRDLTPGSIDDAFNAGVRIVHQELAQCPNLSVAENLCLHDLPTRLGLLDRRVMDDRAASLVHQLDPSIDVRAPLGSLAPGRRQICQIAAALDPRASHGSGPRLIVLDEPTSSLSVAEADRLLQITRDLAARGLTVVYVSHRMAEIFAVCSRVTVLRDGKFVRTSFVNELSESDLVEQMIGRRLATPTGRLREGPDAGGRAAIGTDASALRELAGIDSPPPPTVGHAKSKIKLEVRDLNSPPKLRGVNLTLHAGEILGVGGLVGSGRSELLDAIFGLDPNASGSVLVDGKPLARNGPGDAIRRGVGYVPEDRRLQGLFFDLSVAENIVLPFMHRLAGLLGLRSLRAERALVGDKINDYRVKAASPASLPSELSGGNQQKLLLARWMGRATSVLLLDEPTRGIDVGTKAEVYKLIHQASDMGAAVLLVSSEMPELLALSDRILVMCNGRISGELTGTHMTQANILRLATADSRPAATPPAAPAVNP
ncbi:MAG: sugar ABC transporter ATP-binding protein [Phycisphaeraceae bacterium]|nr:MAG: sugar ABC transporter ATP-binding protein [Phycisphaeraceae bacterium]